MSITHFWISLFSCKLAFLQRYLQCKVCATSLWWPKLYEFNWLLIAWNEMGRVRGNLIWNRIFMHDTVWRPDNSKSRKFGSAGGSVYVKCQIPGLFEIVLSSSGTLVMYCRLPDHPVVTMSFQLQCRWSGTIFNGRLDLCIRATANP
jgi:hypothetical protein